MTMSLFTEVPRRGLLGTEVRRLDPETTFVDDAQGNDRG
jgi:hypothetical protein